MFFIKLYISAVFNHHNCNLFNGITYICTIVLTTTVQNGMTEYNSYIYTVIQKNRFPTSWLSIVKYSVRVMSRYFTIMYVQLIWYSKSLSVLMSARLVFLTECKLVNAINVVHLSRCSWSAARPTFRSFGRPSHIDLSNQSFQWSQRPSFLREFGNKPFCGIVFILAEKFNNAIINYARKQWCQYYRIKCIRWWWVATV